MNQELLQPNYYWIRVFDYKYERDQSDKGVMLDEFYTKDSADRESVKELVKDRYCKATSEHIGFAKPKKGKSGMYAIIMESERFFYNRFYAMINTSCFVCLRDIQGKASTFPRAYIGPRIGYQSGDDVFLDLTITAYFCCGTCQQNYYRIKSNQEGEFQSREEGDQGAVYGYIYLIYNRKEDMHYIGKSRYIPAFRWQEHIKSGLKGDICDLNFSVLSTVRRDPALNEEGNMNYLSSMEAWWINKYEMENHKVMNIVKPKITVDDLREKFNDLVVRQEQLTLDGDL